MTGPARAAAAGRAPLSGPWPGQGAAPQAPAMVASPCTRPTLIFNRTSLPGVVTAESAAVADERGSFTRTYVADLFAAHGLTAVLSVTARASNTRARTLRGLHYQTEPHGETKLVSCARGTIFDVVVDVRAGSPTRYRWVATVLDASRGNAIYIPAGFAHGYLTLTDDAVVLYQMTDSHAPGAERGLRWDDPTLAIDWPVAPELISPRDSALPHLG